MPYAPLANGRALPRPPGRVRYALGLAVAMLLAGCGRNSPELDTQYGARRGHGKSHSVNGTSVLADLFTQNGARVSSWSRLSPKLEQADALVWAPDSFAPPTPEVRRWLEKWLRNRPGRTLVYIGRDYDAATQYWRKVQPFAAPHQAAELARRQAQAQAEFQRARAAQPASEFAGWFVVRGNKSPLTVRTLEGPWSDGVNANQVELELAGRLDIPTELDLPAGEMLALPEAEELLTTQGEALAFRLTHPTWNQGQIIVVANGSFLLNLPLVNHEHRTLASYLVAECNLPQRVTFLETNTNVPEIRASDGKDSAGFALLTVWPLNIILLQAAACGVLYLASRFPIFGRPRELPPATTGDFGKHIDALAQHLARTQELAYAQARLVHYQQTARRESGASHVKPQSVGHELRAPTKPH